VGALVGIQYRRTFLPSIFSCTAMLAMISRMITENYDTASNYPGRFGSRQVDYLTLA